MDGWNTILSFWDGLFSGAKMLVSGRVDGFSSLYSLAPKQCTIFSKIVMFKPPNMEVIVGPML